MKDLEHAADHIQRRLDANAEAKGRKLADNLIDRTMQGRGLWVIILWPIGLIIFVLIGAFCADLLNRAGLSAPYYWCGMIGGFIAAGAWYNLEYTIRHPLLSSILACVIFPVFFQFIAKF
jgi:hypothetical protein